MKYFVVCPSCGHDLLKAEDGSYIEITCPKCDIEVIIDIQNDKLTIRKDVTLKVE